MQNFTPSMTKTKPAARSRFPITLLRIIRSIESLKQFHFL